jgi:YesN/AraC family two-component response regulator
MVYLNYEDDGGDHYITLFVFAITLFSTIAFLSESRFFQKTWLIDKYETQSVSENAPSMEAVFQAVKAETFFTSPKASLKGLATVFETHPNTISRLINQETGGNFNDYLNRFRIDLARERLLSEDYRHLTIEGIGQSVGFRSKSSFYQAFKKQTGKSPSQFVREARTS